MKSKKNIRENIDILGDKWILAPSGRDVIDQCQQESSDLRYEISALGSLFRNLANHEFSDEELYGMGLILEKVSKRLGAIYDNLEKSLLRDK